MPSSSASVASAKRPSPPSLNSYHSDVMQAMCSQMVHSRRPRYHGDMPTPTVRRPSNLSRSISSNTSSTISSPSSSASTSPSSTYNSPPIVSTTISSRRSPPSSANIPASKSGFSQHVQDEMTRRAKADRVLQDLSSDKSRQQARQRETMRRNKWAKNVAQACPSVPEVPSGRKQYAHSRRVNPHVC